MAKKKNKDPPGILDWLVDFFVSPIVTAISDILGSITGHPTEEEKADLKGVVEKIKAAMLSKSSPITVDTAQKELEGWATTGFNNALQAWYLTMITESASFGMVDVSPNAYLNLPQVRGYFDLCAEIGAAEWQLGKMPFLRRHWNRTYTPLVPEPYRLADFAAKSLFNWTTYVKAMAENGLSEQWAYYWAQSQEVYPQLDQLNSLYWRGVIDDETWIAWLKRTGVHEPVTSTLRALREVIPPLGDLIHFAVREAFGDHVPEKQYAEYESWAGKMGLSKYLASCYWYAHWLRMGLGEAYRNVYWGYWDKEQFMKHLYISDVHPDDREAIWRVAWLSPSIRELGYGYDVGVYTEGDIALWRQRGGLSPSDAQKAATAMVAYRTEAERNAVRTEYMYAYGRGKISIDDFEAHLIALGTQRAARRLWLDRAVLYRDRITKEVTPEEPLSITRSTAQWLFERGLRDETWFNSVLVELGYDVDAIEAYLDQSMERIRERIPPTVEVVPRALTMAQLRDLYAAGVIDELEVFNRLIGLEYTDEDALMLVELIVEAAVVEVKPKVLTLEEQELLFDYMRVDEEYLRKVYLAAGYSGDDVDFKVFLAKMEKLWPVMRTLYRNGWISSTELYQWLIEIKMPEDRANVLMMETIKAEQPARTTVERDLTKAEVIKGVKANILTVAQGVELLQGLGYDSSEAQYLLAINKVVAAGDPEGYWELRQIAELAKKARGLAYVEVPPELISLERELRSTQQELRTLTESKAAEERIGEVAVKIAGLETAMRNIILSKKL